MTAGVELREVEAGDLSIFFSHQQDKQAVHMAAFTHEDPSDREAFDAHWGRIQAMPTVVTRTILAGDDVAGHIAKFERDGDAEVTYWIGRAHWGKGIATDALRHFLAEVNNRPLYARAAADNVASLRVLEKCGFVVSGQDRGFAHARGGEIDEAVLRLD